MLNRIFGKSKQETKAQAALKKLNAHHEKLKYEEEVFTKKASAEAAEAKEFMEAGNNGAAEICLERRKLYKQQSIAFANLRLDVSKQIIRLEGARVTTATLDVLKVGASAMKTMQKAMNIDDVERLMDEINEQMENMKQILEALSAPNGLAATSDEDEWESKFEGVDEEQLSQPTTAAPAPPMHDRAGRQQGSPAPQRHMAEETETEPSWDIIVLESVE